MGQYVVFPPKSQKGHGKVSVKKGRALSREKGTFYVCAPYKGHFGNGALLQQEHTDQCMFYSAVLLSPALLFFPSTVSLFSNLQHELDIARNTSNTYLQSTLNAYFYFCMIAQ